MRFLLIASLLFFAGQASAFDQTLHPVEPPEPAPDFALPDVDGELHHMTDYLGRPVIVNFWATWCPPCREEMPSMNRAWQVIQDEDIAMLAINVGEDEDKVFTFTADYPVDFTLLLDESGEIVEQWGVLGLPTTLVVDPQGHIVYRAVGGRAWDDPVLLDKVRALKGE